MEEQIIQEVQPITVPLDGQQQYQVQALLYNFCIRMEKFTESLNPEMKRNMILTYNGFMGDAKYIDDRFCQLDKMRLQQGDELRELRKLNRPPTLPRNETESIHRMDNVLPSMISTPMPEVNPVAIDATKESKIKDIKTRIGLELVRVALANCASPTFGKITDEELALFRPLAKCCFELWNLI